MNKRQAKKWKKKVNQFSQFEWVVNKCLLCEYYEEEDRSVGLMEGCFGDYMYDKEGNYLEDKEDRAIAYMGCKGYTCPYFVRNNTRKGLKARLPKSYREYKGYVRYAEKYFGYY